MSSQRPLRIGCLASCLFLHVCDILPLRQIDYWDLTTALYLCPFVLCCLVCFQSILYHLRLGWYIMLAVARVFIELMIVFR